jgi:ribosomal protein S18 acetylase RimI-like enzyme
VIRRAYRGAEDVTLLQGTNARWIEQVGHSGHLHPGDIAHRFFNGLKLFDVHELVHIWVDRGGEVVAWGAVYPTHRGFDLQVDPGLRAVNPDLEREAIEFLEAEVRLRLAQVEAGSNDLVTDAFSDDEIRIAHLEELGWSRGDEPSQITLRSLDEIPDIVLPPGYVIRAAHGPGDAAGLAEVHASSFGSSWTTGMYEKLMGTPGYDPTRELAAIAPDGRFAAFTVMWFDDRNGIGLFEPVGTGADHRRLGLGTAVLAAGMHRMRAAGLTRAMVMYEDSNPASGALYRSVGFVPTWTIVDYRKPLNPPDSM